MQFLKHFLDIIQSFLAESILMNFERVISQRQNNFTQIPSHQHKMQLLHSCAQQIRALVSFFPSTSHIPLRACIVRLRREAN